MEVQLADEVVALYDSRSGFLRLSGQPVGWTCYSGNGRSINRPQDETIVRVGPIPRGVWAIGNPVDHPRLGPNAIPLYPRGFVHGRSEFFIHGDNFKANRSASSGCIIAPPDARKAIVASRAWFLIVHDGR